GQIKHGADSSFAIWTLSQPYGASEWWPCKNSLTDKIDSIDIHVTTPSKYHDGSNGKLISESISGGYRTCHWKHRYPIATYLVSLNVAEFSIFSDTAIFTGDTLPILNYIWKEDSATAHNSIKSFIPAMLLYDSLFEIYPFNKEKYGHAEMGWGGGMEHQTMTYAGNFGFELLVHECAHQWFGDKITCGSWEDIFLNEGFAVYLTDLCYEYMFNGYYWPFWKSNNLKDITSKPDGSIWVNDTTSVNRIFDSRLTYEKGGYFLHQLRYQVGDSAFFAGVKNYLKDNLLSYNFARWTDLKSHIENASGKNLTTYFNQWFFREGFPSYQLNWSQDASNLISLTVNQTTSLPSSVSFFELDLPIEFKNATKDTIVRLHNTSSGQTYSIQFPFHVDSVKFDPERWLITANNSVTGIAAFSLLPFTINVFPNPANSELIISTNDKLQHINSVSITNVLGEIVYMSNYSTKLDKAIIDCTSLSQNSYLLKVTTDEGELYKKIAILK
ncbi:MAG TPA: M1 family aminopeptidase, partial [Bacteroidia bacterium]